jgi:hypothetical protein
MILIPRVRRNVFSSCLHACVLLHAPPGQFNLSRVQKSPFRTLPPLRRNHKRQTHSRNYTQGHCSLWQLTKKWVTWNAFPRFCRRNLLGKRWDWYWVPRPLQKHSFLCACFGGCSNSRRIVNPARSTDARLKCFSAHFFTAIKFYFLNFRAHSTKIVFLHLAIASKTHYFGHYHLRVANHLSKIII